MALSPEEYREFMDRMLAGDRERFQDTIRLLTEVQTARDNALAETAARQADLTALKKNIGDFPLHYL